MAFSKEKAHERAERFAAKGQHDKAAREYQAIVEHDPKDVRAWLMLADCLVRCGDRAGAINRYIQVADFYTRQKQPQKALAVYRQVLNLDESRVDVHVKCASLYMGLGKVHDAIASYEQVGQAHLAAGHVREALEVFHLIAEADPAVVSKRLRLAELYSREKLVDEAVDAFRLAGDQLIAERRYADYVRVAERLLYHHGDDRPTIRQLSRVYLELGDPRRALMKLNGLLQADQRDREGLELLAETFMALGKPDKAVSVLLELLRELRRVEGSDDETRRVLRRGLSWDPHNDALVRLQDEMGWPAEPHISHANLSDAIDLDDSDEIMELDAMEVVELDDSDVVLTQGDDQDDFRMSARRPSPPMTASVLEEVDEAMASVADGTTDLDKILFEVRVYVKYRLFDHALDHLQELLDQDPYHVGALALRARTLTELDRKHEAADTHIMVARQVAARDPKLAREHLSAALAIVPGHTGAAALGADLGVEIGLGRGAPSAVFEEFDSGGDSGAFDLLEEDEPEFAIEVAEPDHNRRERSRTFEVENRFGLSEAAPLPRPENVRRNSGAPRPSLDSPSEASDIISIQASMEFPGTNASERIELVRPSGVPDSVEDIPTHSAPLDIRDELDALDALDELSAAARVPAEPPAPVAAEPRARQVPDPSVFADLSDDLAEIRFYLDQGLEDDAGAALADLSTRHPGHPDIAAMQAELSGVTAAPVEDLGAQPLVDLASDEDEDEDAYLSAIFSDAPAKPKKKRPVSAIADVEDSDPRTHFDLGMAYREMGLIDDAIGQFETAARDLAWKSRALVMSGTLRVHRGETDRAAWDLRQAIETANTEDERSEANYELGVLYEKVGDTPSAIEYLRSVSAGFRDRDERLDALQGQKRA